MEVRCATCHNRLGTTWTPYLQPDLQLAAVPLHSILPSPSQYPVCTDDLSGSFQA